MKLFRIYLQPFFVYNVLEIQKIGPKCPNPGKLFNLETRATKTCRSDCFCLQNFLTVSTVFYEKKFGRLREPREGRGEINERRAKIQKK